MLPLYKNIKALRLAAKMTQGELARLTGYTDRSSIARIEKGEIDLPQSKIKEFAEALGTTPSVLMGWVDSDTDKKNDSLSKAIAIARKNDLTEDISNLMALFEQSPEQYRNFSQILSGLVNK